MLGKFSSEVLGSYGINVRCNFEIILSCIVISSTIMQVVVWVSVTKFVDRSPTSQTIPIKQFELRQTPISYISITSIVGSDQIKTPECNFPGGMPLNPVYVSSINGIGPIYFLKFRTLFRQLAVQNLYA